MTNPHSMDSKTKTCPQEERLHAAIQGGLSADELSQLSEHLTDCDACQERMQQLAGADDVLPADQPVNSDDIRSNALDSVIKRLRRQEPSQSLPTDAELLRFLKPPTDPESGSIGEFGAYDVLEMVGRGGMGVVFKAYDRSLNRVVAIKVLLPELATTVEHRQRFMREAQAAAAVIHENVVTIHAVDEHDNLPYLVMEYIEGESLQKRIENGRISVPEILRIGSQVSAGLEAAHAQGLVHRDIKPANILLQNGIARVKITDFGLAKAVDDVSITRTGTIAGTPQYLSPEQADSQTVDHRTDLFSLGGVLYAMCTGMPPFAGNSTARIIRQVCDAQPRPIAKLNEDIPASLIGVIRKLLEKDPRRRFATALDVEETLRNHLSRLQRGGGSRSVSTLLPKLATSLAGVAVLGAAIYFTTLYFRGDRAPSGTNQVQQVAAARVSRDFQVAGSDVRYGTLSDAVEAANDGDMIEIFGNGPYTTRPIQITDKALTIRAADRYRPLIRVTNHRFAIGTERNLRLEGLVLRVDGDAEVRGRAAAKRGVIASRGDELEVSHCSLESRDTCGLIFEGKQCRIENCSMDAPNSYGVTWQLQTGATLTIENSSVAARGAVSMVRSVPLAENEPCQLKINYCNLAADLAIRYLAKSTNGRLEHRTRLGNKPTVEVAVSNSIVDSDHLFQFNAPPTRNPPRLKLAEQLLVTLIDWSESQNFYRDSMVMATIVVRGQDYPLLPGTGDLNEWQQQFEIENAQSIEGIVEYQVKEDGSTDFDQAVLTPSPAADVKIGVRAN